MSLVWFNDNLKDIFATLTNTQITLNKYGATYLESANKVLLGYDAENSKIVIKPLSKDEVIRGDIPESSLYNISISASYARVTNKAFLSTVIDLFNLDLPKEGFKYKTVWNEKHKVLEILLKERE